MINYNDFIKRPYEEFPYEQWHIEEIIKCQEDMEHFFKYVKIINGDGNEVSYIPYDFQKKLLDIFVNHRFSCSLCSRQSGKSSTVAIFSLWYAIFNSDKTIGIVSNKKKSATGFLDRIKIIYERLPNWLKPGVLEYNKTSIMFDNGTRILTSATTPDAFRSFTINLLIADELAFVPKNQADDFWAANYPTVSSSMESRIIVISTPNGLYNLFHNLYLGGETGKNTFKTFKSTWRDVPGRDEKWAEEQIRNLGAVKFNQEYECKFIGSSQTLIDASVLENLSMYYEEPLKYDFGEALRVYEQPVKDCLYVIGVDVATGSGGDYSTVQVLKILSESPLKVEQVAVYENNTIDTYSFGDVVTNIGLYYNTAYIMLESNAEGAVTANRIWWGNEYDNFYNETNKTLGIKSNKKTKMKATMLMKKIIEDGTLKIRDKRTIEQLSDFIEKNGKLSCRNLNDDLVAALYWGCYVLDSKIMKAVIGNKNIAKTRHREDVFGILSDNITINNSWDSYDYGATITLVT